MIVPRALAVAVDHFGAICAWFPGILDTCKTWSTSSSSTTSTVAFVSADVLDSMFNYLAMTISPYVAVLCFVGAAINYQRSKPWGVVALSGLAFLSFSGLWSLVTGWMGATITW